MKCSQNKNKKKGCCFFVYSHSLLLYKFYCAIVLIYLDKKHLRFLWSHKRHSSVTRRKITTN